MDDRSPPGEADSLPLQGPHWQQIPNVDMPPGFMPMRLVLQPGGLAVELTKADNLVGRHSGADICLRLPDVSRRHCRFVFAQDHWQVFDLQSLNGIFLNDERVLQAPLQHRDRLRIGSYLFEVDLQPGLMTMQLPAKGPRTAEQILGSISEALPRRLPDPDPDKMAS